MAVMAQAKQVMAVKAQAKPRYDTYVISLKIWHLHIKAYNLQLLPSKYLYNAYRIKKKNQLLQNIQKHILYML